MEKTYVIHQRTRQFLADTLTPVSIYLGLRDVFKESVLLESSDYHGHENSYSFICIRPLANFRVKNSEITETYPDKVVKHTRIVNTSTYAERLQAFIKSFRETGRTPDIRINGLFGYTSYDAVRYFETLELRAPRKVEHDIPDVYYNFYQYVIAVNHFKNTITMVENLTDGEESKMDMVEALIKNRSYALLKFSPQGDETSNLSDEEYIEIVRKGKKHCFRGDVFQVVLSRQFSQAFTGDDFNVYRALRSINPSPYLFYFDLDGFRIFGSSPEDQLRVIKNKAFINPIAGTFKRTGDDERDKQLAKELAADPKENAEHVMLVDLARNDLSIRGGKVTVESFREIQYYSHVLHMVSKVSAELFPGTNVIDVMTATFPAGTLSGAPKFKAMEIIDACENQNRGFYGGAIGMIDFNGDIVHAITIRSFLSKNNRLYYQAGAGIVAASDEQSELQEVNNKLGALKKAIVMAKEL